MNTFLIAFGLSVLLAVLLAVALLLSPLLAFVYAMLTHEAWMFEHFAMIARDYPDFDPWDGFGNYPGGGLSYGI